MAQHGKQMRVGACRGFVYHSIKLVLLANGNRYEVDFNTLFKAEGFGLPCTAWAGSGLLVKSRLIRIRADEGARERTRSFKIELVLAATGRDIPIKRDGHAKIYYVMNKQAWWGNADGGS
jgi:hypothetical protein